MLPGVTEAPIARRAAAKAFSALVCAATTLAASGPGLRKIVASTE